MFPAGVAGIGLAILRVCVVASLFVGRPLSADLANPILEHILTISLMIALCLGAFTPVASVLVLLLQANGLRAGADSAAESFVHILMTASLLMLGPGAYSIDARLFGRRLINPPSDWI